MLPLRGDKILWSTALLLGIVGLLLVYSATVGLVFRYHPTMPEYYLVKQALMLLVAFFIAYALHLTDYRRWGPLFEVGWWISLALLIYLFFRGSGAQRWMYIGGLSFQPSELARSMLMGTLAYRMALQPENLQTWQSALPLLGRIGITFALIAPLNLSNGLLLLGFSLIFLYIGGMPLRTIGQITLMGLGVLLFVFFTAPRSRIWQARLAHFWKKENVPADDYQRAHASLAVYSGGLWGKGPGHSTQRYYLPQSYSDFAFSVLIEEYGLIGGILILGLYGIFLWRIAGIATIAQGMGQLFSIGSFLLIALQVGVHVGVSLEVLPITGVPLPWISLGGTSLLVQAFLLGMLGSISHHSLSR
ncbi:MAG: FtsW/RodA/SpoVE family cell cycle protein [Bacteroidia bacterium]|nr:FtsW/RodA/SpoVE family cell cycle protein [Bacteroidia bacterium]